MQAGAVGTKEFTVCHWNVEEMRTKELLDPQNQRIYNVCQSILKHSNRQIPDIACFNEVQYGLPGVPKPLSNPDRHGPEELRLIWRRLNSQLSSPAKEEDYDFVFHPGNCGMHGRSSRMQNGNYNDTRNLFGEERLKLGDLVNCVAHFPGQYGVGFWRKRSLADCHRGFSVISELKWKDFHPDIDLSKYRLADQKTPPPEDIPLFDKCLLRSSDKINGRNVTTIFTHTVPSFNFGNPLGTSIDRNRDQLAFLEWMLTGTTYFVPPGHLRDDLGNEIKPLRSGEPFVAMGDLNVDWRSENPGASIMNSLHNKPGLTVFPWGTDTNTGYTGTKMQLDYIISSGLTIVDGSQSVAPIERELSDHALLTASFRV